MNRTEIIKRIKARKSEWDIVIIGGGATGVGSAVDAASRGFDVLLLEQHDFGKGTSSRSTKLIHGGVRYLTQGNISLVREALKERGILIKNAPHVVHKQAFIVPCYSLWEKIFYGAGLKIYDLLSGKYSFGKSVILSRDKVIERLRNVACEGLRGGVLYYDGQFDDTRLLIDLVKTAHDQGVAVLNYAKVIALTKNAKGNLNGVAFEDVETHEEFSVKAKCVINATGAFCDALRQMSDDTAKPVVTYSQGIHLVFDRKFLPRDTALMIPKTSDGRVLFCIPWHDHLLIGTTDTPMDNPSLEPEALGAEIDFVLESAGEYLAVKPTRGDILSVFAGIRPLVKSGKPLKTSSLSRGHDLFVDDSGLITITGGKWTTYRRMAEDAVDKAIEISGLEYRNSGTEDLFLAGPPTSRDGERLHPNLPYTLEDVVLAVRDEMARTVEDVLARRTRALFLNARVAMQIVPRVAEIMAEELVKDKDWIEREIASFKELALSYSRPFG